MSTYIENTNLIEIPGSQEAIYVPENISIKGQDYMFEQDKGPWLGGGGQSIVCRLTPREVHEIHTKPALAMKISRETLTIPVTDPASMPNVLEAQHIAIDETGNVRFVIQDPTRETDTRYTYNLEDQYSYIGLRNLKEPAILKHAYDLLKDSPELRKMLPATHKVYLVRNIAKSNIPDNKYAHYHVAIVQEILKGGNMDDKLTPREPRSSEEKRITIADSLSDLERLSPLVDRLHQMNIIHRDLFPTNIAYRIRPDGVEEPVLLDFGYGLFHDQTLTEKRMRVGRDICLPPAEISKNIGYNVKPNAYSDQFGLAMSIAYILHQTDDASKLRKDFYQNWSLNFDYMYENPKANLLKEEVIKQTLKEDLGIAKEEQMDIFTRFLSNATNILQTMRYKNTAIFTKILKDMYFGLIDMQTPFAPMAFAVAEYANAVRQDWLSGTSPTQADSETAVALQKFTSVLENVEQPMIRMLRERYIHPHQESHTQLWEGAITENELTVLFESLQQPKVFA